jgi:hypothetical protein
MHICKICTSRKTIVEKIAQFSPFKSLWLSLTISGKVIENYTVETDHCLII